MVSNIEDQESLHFFTIFELAEECLSFVNKMKEEYDNSASKLENVTESLKNAQTGSYAATYHKIYILPLNLQ
jgi:hypothetical protein